MNNKILNILAILCVIAIVGFMSWRDMHPKIDISTTPASTGVTYFVGVNITPDMVPDDSRPLTIGLGGFVTTPDGKTEWMKPKRQPTTFAQRQVNLQFHLEGLPRDPTETLDNVKSMAEDWVHKGNTINVLIFDYSPDENPDLNAYAAFLKAAHNAFKGKYVIYAYINIMWPEASQKDALNALQDSSPQFVIRCPHEQLSAEMLSKLAAFKYNFILELPVGTQLAGIDNDSLKKLGSLTGLTVPLDPHYLLLKQEEKIGLFPKL